MRIEVSFDADAFRRGAEDTVTRKVLPGLQDAVDYMAAAARKALSEATSIHFQDPVDWTVNAFAYKRVAAGPDTAASMVYVLPEQARYLAREVVGGVRVAGDYATVPGGSLVPGRDAVTDADGNLPRDYVENAESEGARWVHLKPGAPEALVLPGRGRLQVLAVVAERVAYAPRFPFFDIVERAVFDKAPAAVAKYLA